LEISKLVLN